VSALRARSWVRPPPGLRWLPPVGCALAAVVAVVGLVITATGGYLGTALPPFVLVYSPEADPLLVASVVVLGGAAIITPRLIDRSAPAWATAAALYMLALALGLALNIARAGSHGWWSMFDSAHGSYEAKFEYLPGLYVLNHGVGYYLKNFAFLLTYVPTHTKGNPPGPLAALYLLGIRTGPQLAALCIGMGALCAPLAYDLGRTLGGEQRGRVAGVLTAFAPSVLLFGVTSADYAFAAMGIAVACLLARRHPAAVLAGGALAGIVALFSYLLLAIPVFAALLVAQRDGLRRAVLVAVACAVGVVAVNAVLWAGWGYDPVAALRATSHFYHQGIALTRPYAFWVFGSPVAWGLMLGPPVLWYLLRSLSNGDISAVAVTALIVVASLLGMTKAETERIWLPFVPLACVAAAATIPRARLRPALWCLVAQGLAVELLFFTIW
jgi:hypothetical protein